MSSVGRGADQTRWTVPYPGSRYPVILVPESADPSALSVRVLGAVAVAVAFAGFAIVVPSVNLFVQAVSYALVKPGTTLEEYVAAGQKFETVAGLVGAHLGLASLTLVVMALLRVLHRRRSAWLWSVSPGMRWRYLLATFIVGVAVLNAVMLLFSGLPAWAPQDRAGVFVVAIVLTAPLQAVAEEVFFRGYLLQAFGMVWRNSWFAIGASALLFALFHGTQNVPLFLDRLAFGLIAGALVWRTGGLEAGIGAHIANNLGAFLWAALTSSVAGARAVQELTWLAATQDVLGFALFAAIAWWVAARMRVPEVVAGGPSAGAALGVRRRPRSAGTSDPV